MKDSQDPSQIMMRLNTQPWWKRVLVYARLGRYFMKYYRLQKTLANVYFAHAVVAFNQLGIAECLHTNPKSCDDVAKQMDLHAATLNYFLELLARLGLLRKERQAIYSLTALGDACRAGNVSSLHGSILSMGELISPAWDNLSYTVKTGEPAFDKVFGADFYSHMRQEPQKNAYFAQWMAETNRDIILPLLALLDFSHARTIVDVGGNTGLLITLLLQQYPHVRGILFDQPYLAEDARKTRESAGVADSCQFIGGDFFASIPTGGDVYILSRVLDNWKDEQTLVILKNCRTAMPPSSHLVILDSVFPEKNANRFMLMGALHLIVMGGGVMRTKKEYNHLLQQAGFKKAASVGTTGMVSVLETMPSVP